MSTRLQRRHPSVASVREFPRGLRLSVPLYFACVALATALGVSTAMWLRPAFAYTVRSALGLEKRARALPGSFYTVRVQPLLEEHCTSCHGPIRRKADLRLDSIAAVMRGGKHGAVLQAGNLKGSELLTRVLLPPGNDKAMPPSGKPPMSADEITVIKLWVAAGASGALQAAAIKNAPPPVVKLEFPEIDERAVAQSRAPLAQAVKQLQAQFPGLLSYISRGSADLQVNASLLGRAFGDKEFAALAPVRARVVNADFSGTSISDASAQAFAEYTHLRVLRLADTRLTDTAIAPLLSVKTLESLTVAGTALKAASLVPLRGKGVRIYDGSEPLADTNAVS